MYNVFFSLNDDSFVGVNNAIQVTHVQGYFTKKIYIISSLRLSEIESTNMVKAISIIFFGMICVVSINFR